MATPRKPGSMYGWGWREKLAVLVPPGAPGECWPAQVRLDPDGYARMSAQDTKETLIHRLVVLAEGREIPPGYEVDHTCRRRDCGNPAHLDVVPKIVNIQRANALREVLTVCVRGHDRTNPYKDGSCRECKRAWYLARKALMA